MTGEALSSAAAAANGHYYQVSRRAGSSRWPKRGVAKPNEALIPGVALSH